MSENTAKSIRLQQRVDTKAKWEQENPVLLNKEIGYETDGKYKIGNGITNWNNLPYAKSSADLNIENGIGENGIQQKGNYNQATGKDSSSFGYYTKATQQGAHSEGGYTQANGVLSHAEGHYSKTASEAEAAHAEGRFTNANGAASHAEGAHSVALGNSAHAEGNATFWQKNSDQKNYTITGTKGSTLLTVNNDEFFQYIKKGFTKIYYVNNSSNIATILDYDYENTTITVDISLITQDTQNNKELQVIIYQPTIADGFGSHAEGQSTIAINNFSHAEGYFSEAQGEIAHAEGYDTRAIGEAAHAEGKFTQAQGESDHAEGYRTITGIKGYHCLPIEDTSVQDYKKKVRLEGNIENLEYEINDEVTFYDYAGGNFWYLTPHNTNSSIIANIDYDSDGVITITMKEEIKNTFIGEGSFICVLNKPNSGNLFYSVGAHSEGYYTKSYGFGSHAEGVSTTAIGYGAHAEGLKTYAYGDYSHVEGKYNIEDTANNYAHILGNGSRSQPSNAHTIDWNGNAWFAGDIYIGGTSMDNATKISAIRTSWNKSFAETSWEDIVWICQNKTATTWKVGDTKSMTLTDGSIYDIVIIGTNHDQYASGGYAPYTFQFKNCYNTSPGSAESFESTAWPNSPEINMLNKIHNLIPYHNNIQLIKKDTVLAKNRTNEGGGNNDYISTKATANVKLFNLSDSELGQETYGYNQYGDTVSYQDGIAYTYYTGTNSKIKYTQSNTSVAVNWLLRNITSKYDYIGANYITTTGSHTNSDSDGSNDYTVYVAPAFCF